MTAEIDLLPLPEASKMYDIPGYDEEEMKDYARANVARNTALLRAEIEALRAEVERWKRVNAEQVKLHVKAEIRAEQLAEVLETCLEMEERPEVIKRARAAIAALSKEEGK